MADFTKIHAQFVRRTSDSLEVEFISRHELRYAKASRELIIFIETYIAGDGAPDGCYTFLTDLQLDSPSRAEVEADLIAAAVPLLTKFHFR